MAAVTPLGAQIYTTQASPLVSQHNQTVTQRFDMQSFVAMQMEQNKEPEVKPVIESDGSQKINADADGGKNSEQYESQEREKKENEEAKEPHKSDHILDLKV